jgi:hypothetical protein
MLLKPVVWLISFYTTYLCNTPAFIGRPELNYGGKSTSAQPKFFSVNNR